MDWQLSFIIEERSTFVSNVVSLLVLPNLAALKLSPVLSPFGGQLLMYLGLF